MPEEDFSKKDRIKRNVEWTFVIVIVSAVMGTAFFAWKRGSDRADCIFEPPGCAMCGAQLFGF